ncbi:type VI secretion system protein ImpL [Rosenbergiella nectarea]|uniref:Type VI secretion system protein ImpL n=1 Tax=Rosenbergiella nectarea TaxID=988801 RepID=A0A1H9M8Q1_9GAMM|nr:type VI secretion system membrane subunit TssM [Rosenbergiella nectarea]SER19951.1 type VI secretion system protein ImpL [Rosenbergiella nectarea]
MSVLNRLFSGVIWPRVLLITLCVLLTAACWLLGPWLGFGEARPLEPVSSRIIVVVMLASVLMAYWLRLPLFISLTLVVLALIWVAGPWLLVGKGYPLRLPGHRLLLMAVVAFVALTYGVWRLLQALARNPALLSRWIKKPSSTQKNAAQANTAIHTAVARGMQYMRQIQQVIPRWQRFFGLRRATLPWFLMLGAPSAGKTALLLSSGQDFPLPEQLSRKNSEAPPTGSCECLFTNQAVFIDTAGRFVSETNDGEEEWSSLLSALKKSRPTQGINGAIVTLSVEDILHKTQTERLAMAAALRGRISEAREKLGVRFPIYVIVTKLDLLNGFTDFFRNLTLAEREQIWGVTLDWEKALPHASQNLHHQLKQEFDLLHHRLSSAVYLRQQEEYDLGDRKRLYAFPDDFAQLASIVNEMVNNIFFASRYDETDVFSALRGVYFTSSCQPQSFSLFNNQTLLQRWHQLVRDGKLSSLPSDKRSLSEEQVLLSENAWSKHYFLTQLFGEVIGRDGDLVRYNLQRHAASRLKNLFGHLACWGGAIWLTLALCNSYQLNHGYLNALDKKLSRVALQLENYTDEKAVNKLMPLLSTTRALAKYPGLNLNDPDQQWRYGLYTGYSIAAGADSLYHFVLQHYLLPELVKKAHDDLQLALNSSDDQRVWTALKSYLMLTRSTKGDYAWLVSQLSDSWLQSRTFSGVVDVEPLQSYLNDLFNLKTWQKSLSPADDTLITRARARLGEKDESARLWQRIEHDSAKSAPANLTLQAITGSESPQLFYLSDSELNQKGIPGLYTHAGWEQVVKKKMLTSLLLLQREDSWVMGETTGLKSLADLHNRVLTQYLQNYATYWQRFLDNLQLISLEEGQSGGATDIALNIALLRTMVSDHSPLTTVFQRVANETVLTSGSLPGNNKLSTVVNKGFADRSLIKQLLDDRFAALRTFVLGDTTKESGPTEFLQAQGNGLNGVLMLLRDQYTRFVVYNSAFANIGGQQMALESAQMGAQEDTWPAAVRNVVSPLLSATFNKVQQRDIARSTAAIGDGLGEVCRRSFQGRYPFADSKREVSVPDFVRFFAPGGIVDSWFKQNLAEKVDTSHYPWRFKGTSNTEGLAFFEQAAAIRALFFSGDDNQKPALNFSATVRFLAPEVREFILSFNGEALKYAHGPLTVQALNWSAVRQGSEISMALREDQAGALPDLHWQGPWALLHWLDAAETIRDTPDGNLLLQWGNGKKRVELQLDGLAVNGAMPGDVLRDFRCPETGTQDDAL